MKHLVLSQQMKDMISLTAELAIEKEESTSRAADPRKLVVHSSYSLNWTEKTLGTLISFVAENESGFAPELMGDLTLYMKNAGQMAVEQRAQADQARLKYIRLYILVIILATLGLILWVTGDIAPYPGWALGLGVLMIVAASVIIWKNRIRMPKIQEHLQNDEFTKEDCAYLFNNTYRAEQIKKAVYIGAVVMAVLGLVVMAIPRMMLP